MKKLLVCILFAAGAISCSPTKNEDQVLSGSPGGNSRSLEINNKAVEILGRALHSNDSVKHVLLDSALTFLNDGIRLDSLFLPLHANKSKIQLRMGLYDEAIKSLDRAIKIDPDFSEAIMGRGFIYEKIKRLDLAQNNYESVLKMYLKRLELEPNNVSIQSSVAFTYLFAENQDKAKDEISQFILENPDSKELRSMEEIISHFDRRDFIDNY